MPTAFLEGELANPVDLDAHRCTLRRPKSSGSSSIPPRALAIEPDSRAERGYLDLLAGRLGLADALVDHIEATVVGRPSLISSWIDHQFEFMSAGSLPLQSAGARALRSLSHSESLNRRGGTMRDLNNWKGCPAPKPVALEGPLSSPLEPYDRASIWQALWEALGGMGINPLLKYFAQADFAGIEDFAAWLTTVQKAGWLTEVFRDKATGKVVGMANYMRADPANGVVEVGGVAHGPAMARSPLSTEVHYLMAKHVFEDLGYRRYEWKCDNENEAEQDDGRRATASPSKAFSAST